MVIDSFFVVEDSVVTGVAIVEMLKSTDTFRGGRVLKSGSCRPSRTQLCSLTNLKSVAHLQTESLAPFLIRHICAHLKS